MGVITPSPFRSQNMMCCWRTLCESMRSITAGIWFVPTTYIVSNLLGMSDRSLRSLDRRSEVRTCDSWFLNIFIAVQHWESLLRNRTALHRNYDFILIAIFSAYCRHVAQEWLDGKGQKNREAECCALTTIPHTAVYIGIWIPGK